VDVEAVREEERRVAAERGEHVLLVHALLDMVRKE
jgi:hypothetical protein